MFIETYSKGAVEQTRAVEAVARGEGNIFPLVVRERRTRAEGFGLVYGFFFADEKGGIWDVIMAQRVALKTLSAEDKAMRLLKEIYPDAIGFELPMLCEENVVERGQLDGIRIPRPIFPDKKKTKETVKK